MRALTYDDAGLHLIEADEPSLDDSRALVEIHAVSLNFGELSYRQPVQIPGWDAAGVVIQAAADGSGPPPGSRVTTFDWSGGWAQRRAAETGNLAVVPETVDLGAAAALPVAGVTALQAVRRLGAIIGRRVLVTGASGGVGRFAVQLAARAGAEVVALVGSPARGEQLLELGAAEVVTGLDQVEENVFGVLDNVGGAQLADAFALLETGGSAQSIGKASGEATVIDFEAERHRPRGRRIEPFTISTPVGPDLTYLVGLLAKGDLDPQIGWRGNWDRAAEAADALRSRRVRGKAVLDLQ